MIVTADDFYRNAAEEALRDYTRSYTAQWVEHALAPSLGVSPLRVNNALKLLFGPVGEADTATLLLRLAYVLESVHRGVFTEGDGTRLRANYLPINYPDIAAEIRRVNPELVSLAARRHRYDSDFKINVALKEKVGPVAELTDEAMLRRAVEALSIAADPGWRKTGTGKGARGKPPTWKRAHAAYLSVVEETMRRTGMTRAAINAEMSALRGSVYDESVEGLSLRSHAVREKFLAPGDTAQ